MTATITYTDGLTLPACVPRMARMGLSVRSGRDGDAMPMSGRDASRGSAIH
jgi:hypothetical protein